MKFGAHVLPGGALLLSFGLLQGCSSNANTLPLIVDGDQVRLLAAPKGCPADAAHYGFDDTSWQVATLPLTSVPESGVCVRKQFDVGTHLSEYRWLEIQLTDGAQAQLNYGAGSSKEPSNASQQGLAWQANRNALATAAASQSAASGAYLLDLQLFPELLQPEDNVLALAVPAMSPTGRQVEVHALLRKDGGGISAVPTLANGPYLVKPSPTSIEVQWETNVAAPSWAVLDGKRYDGGWAVHHSVAIDGLVPGKYYSLYVTTAQTDVLPTECTSSATPAYTAVKVGATHSPDRPNDSDDGLGQYIQRNNLCSQFQAAIRSTTANLHAASGTSLRMVVLGDTHASPDGSGDVLGVLGPEAPDLIVHTGDVVKSAGEANWSAFFAAAAPALMRAPIAAAIGERDNLEWADRFGQLFDVESGSGSGHSYSLDSGLVHLAFVDSSVPAGEQAAWLDADLTTAQAAGAQRLLVVMHRNPWSSGAIPSDIVNGTQLLPVLQAHGVQAVFSGHSNVYEHGVVAGMHYFVSGGGGSVVDPTTLPGPNTTTLLPVPHYLVVTADASGVTVTAKSPAGAILERTRF